MLKNRISVERAACFLLLFCSSVCIYQGCRKPEPDKLIMEKMEAMNAEAPVTIKFSEIYQKLPQTIVYAAAAKLNFYTTRAEWMRTETNLTVRIPLDATGHDFIYGVKEFNKPEETNVYIVTLELEDGATEVDFTGKKWWLDLQDWTYYAIQYEHNIAIKGITPEIISKPGWEQCMLDEGVFEVNDQGEMNIARNPYRCPPNPNRNGSSFWQNLKDFFEGLGGDDSGGSSGGAGGSAGGGIGNGTGYVFGGPMNGSFNNGPGIPGNNGMGGGGSWNSNPSGTAGVFNVDEVENNGVVTPVTNPVVTFVKNLLNLNTTRTDYLYMHPEVASSVMNYLLTPAPSIGNISVVQRNANAVEHIDAMNLMPDYNNDITTYISNPTHHWWDIDGDGLVKNKKVLLEITLQSKPFTTLSCSELSQLPMNMYQEVASYPMPQSVLNKVSNIQNLSAFYSNPYFGIKLVNNAWGGIVNCDYFYIDINHLPYQNGVQMTADQFLEYFRTHINSFIQPGVNASFGPYIHSIPPQIYLDETAIWNSAYEGSLSSIVHIDMLNDGTVIESGYNRNAITQHSWFMFTTMVSPLDGPHPVSGNRRFGIFKSGNKWYFYTMGVDRTNTIDVTIANALTGVAFDGADELWRSVQTGVLDFFDTHQGDAVAKHEIIARPYWIELRKFLKGQITLQQYKAQNNCP